MVSNKGDRAANRRRNMIAKHLLEERKLYGERSIPKKRRYDDKKISIRNIEDFYEDEEIPD